MAIAIDNNPNPSKIMEIGMGFWASKTLLTAVNMELFTLLAKGELSGDEIQNKLNLHGRSLYDFLDALVSLNFLKRSGIKESAIYSNTQETDLFLDRSKPSYIGGILEMSNNRLYPFWGNLEECLKTGELQNEAKDGGQSVFELIYADQSKLREFLHAMGGVQMGNFIALANNFDFSKYKTLCDVGGSGANLSILLATKYKDMSFTSFDLPPVAPIAQENVDNAGLSERIIIQSGDFFVDDIPQVDIITMGNILHDWGLNDKLKLIQKAYDALPKGGSLIVIENIIDNDRSKNTFGLLMSLNMAIENHDGFDFTFNDFNTWARKIGFSSVFSISLTGPTSAAIAIK